MYLSVFILKLIVVLYIEGFQGVFKLVQLYSDDCIEYF